MIVAAIETGCRQGELLALIWRYVSLDRGVIRIRAENTKNSTYKEIPISARLRAVLEMARHDPAGQRFGPHHYPFGNAIGKRLGSPKKAWATACRKAGITDLRFHDLRHEAGSLRLEEGWTLHQVRDLLGHADVKTTDTYLNVTTKGLQAAMQRSDELRCKKVASSEAKEPRLPRNDMQTDDDKSLIH